MSLTQCHIVYWCWNATKGRFIISHCLIWCIYIRVSSWLTVPSIPDSSTSTFLWNSCKKCDMLRQKWNSWQWQVISVKLSAKQNTKQWHDIKLPLWWQLWTHFINDLFIWWATVLASLLNSTWSLTLNCDHCKLKMTSRNTQFLINGSSLIFKKLLYSTGALKH